jgi:asparagine synthase (glutamine-hydrolysing)
MHRQIRGAYDIARQTDHELVAAHGGVELRYPLWDRRLIEFLLHIPHHLRSWQGLDGVLARESLRGTLPESVRNRLSKGRYDRLAHRGLHRQQASIEALLQDSRAEASGFLDARALRAEFRSYWRSDTAHDQEEFAGCFPALWKSVYLEAWLRYGEGNHLDTSVGVTHGCGE